MYENRNYLIIPVSELSKVDFEQVCETSADTVRKSADQTKTFIKWDGDAPSFLESLEGKQGPYTYDEIIEILNSEEWTVSGTITQS
jgi:Tol biopolymer transport system component